MRCSPTRNDLRRILLTLALILVSTPGAIASTNPYATWTRGPSTNPHFFPIAVWLQNPNRADRYREAGFNTYVGLWHGPTDAQLAELKAAGMKVICDQNQVGLAHIEDPTIIGWMHGDEPDNAQSLGPNQGYGPPIPPETIVRDYQAQRAADPSRPILLNLGQGVAWDNWYGRGVRTRHPEDYPKYAQGGDIISFDIYPTVHSHPEVAGNLWFVANGVERLIQWTDGLKVIWNCIECTRIDNPNRKPSPLEVRAEVWMALIRGSQGLIYFVHEWQPHFNEAALLNDPAMLAAVTRINRQILQLAPVLNQPVEPHPIQVLPLLPDHPLAVTTRRHDKHRYIFAVNLRNAQTTRTFVLPQESESPTVEVLDEARQLPVVGRQFQDRFQPWEVHLYRYPAQPMAH